MSHQPPPPPGTPNLYAMPDQMMRHSRHRHDIDSKSGTITTMTSLTSITNSNPKVKNDNNYANPHPVNEHNQYPYAPDEQYNMQ